MTLWSCSASVSGSTSNAGRGLEPRTPIAGRGDRGAVKDIAGAVAFLGSEPGRTALFTDYDGTLSPIVAHPGAALPLPGATKALRELVGRLAVVGVVSGRPIEFLVDRLGLEAPPGRQAGTRLEGRPVLHAYGLHGLEHWAGDGSIEIEPAVLAWRHAVEAARDRARLAALPGVEIEDKVYGVTLHWRNAPDPSAVEPAASALAVDLAEAGGLLARPGKASVELVPPVGVDKGSVVRRWGGDGRVKRIGFLGDDTSDVLAFEALDSLTAEDGLQGLKVAVDSPEAPPALLESADLILASPAEAVELIGRLARFLGAPNP
jgi:trehalose 6-phosphate phosphatase